MNEPLIYTLIGGPYKVVVRGHKSANYYQAYRIPGDKKLYRAPCCRELAKSRNRCSSETHIRAHKAKTDPLAQHADCTLQQHPSGLHLESLPQVAGRFTGYINHTRDRIVRVNDCLKWTRPSDVDGLKLKAWLAKMHQEGQVIQRKNSKAKRKFSMSLRTMGYYWTNYRMFLVLARNDRIATNPLKTKWENKGDVPVAFTRRAMTDDEFQRIITATAEGRSTTVSQARTGRCSTWRRCTGAACPRIEQSDATVLQPGRRRAGHSARPSGLQAATLRRAATARGVSQQVAATRDPLVFFVDGKGLKGFASTRKKPHTNR